MTNTEKKKYNREHYRKNKEVILNKAKTKYKSKNQDRGDSRVIHLFDSHEKIQPPPPRTPKFKNRLRAIPWRAALIGTLVITISGFLFNETE